MAITADKSTYIAHIYIYIYAPIHMSMRVYINISKSVIYIYIYTYACVQYIGIGTRRMCSVCLRGGVYNILIILLMCRYIYFLSRG